MSASNFSEVLKHLQSFVATADIAAVDAPVSVGLSASGHFYITHSLSPVPVRVDGVDGASEYIAKWLTDHIPKDE